MSGESENVKSISSEAKQNTEKADSNNDDSKSVTDEKDQTETANSKEVNSKSSQNSIEDEEKDEKSDIKSDEDNENEEGTDDDKPEKKVEGKKDIKADSPSSECDKDNDTPKKDENKTVSKSESSVEKSTVREKKKLNQVADDSNSGDSKEVKTDIPVGTGVQLGDIPRIDASISRFKNDDLKLLHRLLYKTPGKTTLIKKNIKKFNGFDFIKDSDEYNKKIDSAKKFELKQLKSICEMLDLEKKGAKEEIIERVIGFLLEPKDSGKAVGGGRPKRTAAVRANNRGYSSHDDSYSSDERRVSSRGGRGKGKRTNLKDDTTSESDEEFHPSDASETKSRGTKRRKGSGRKKLESDEEEEDEVSPADETLTSEDTDDEPRKRKKIKKVVNVNNKGRGRPKGTGRKSTVETTEKKPTSSKKVSNKRSKESSAESEPEDANSSSSEDEPLIKKAKSVQPPTDDEISKYVKEILDGANLEEITMKTVCKQVYAHYPDFDLAHKKEFIKNTVKSLIST